MTTLEKANEQQELKSESHENNVEVQRNSFVPGTDVVDSEGKVDILVEMPGVNKESVNISLEKNILTIYGEVRNRASREGYSLIVREFPVGNYHRTFTLSQEFDDANIQASMKEGVLHLTLPKRKDVGPRRINVNAE